MTAENWLARDAAVVWHPFTQHSQWVDDEPLVFERAEGPWLFDTNGDRYLDGVSSLWTTTVGHRHPVINAAVISQLERLDHATFLGATHTPGIELAERMVASAPSGAGPDLAKVFFAGDGSSAVEAALKMAYQSALQKGEMRPYFVHLRHSYHGDTLGSVSVGGIELFHATYGPILLQTLAIGSPGEAAPTTQVSVTAPGSGSSGAWDRLARAREVGDELAALLDSRGSEICAVIVEPMVQGAAGILTYDAEFLRAARRWCDQHGVLLICDEVATGVGRTGKMWASEHAGIVPDLLTCGKGLTGGYFPLSAVLATDEIYQAFLGSPTSGRTFFHGHTYTANPVTCAAANANLELMATGEVLTHAEELAGYLRSELAPLSDHPAVTEIRQCGLMIGVEVRPNIERAGFAVCQAMRKRGVWVRPLGDTVVLMPPLTLAEPEAKLLVGALGAGLAEALG